ncbi:MAG: metallophosphoesterase family protein [Candidatus Odinarchaeia archaeon]
MLHGRVFKLTEFSEGERVIVAGDIHGDFESFQRIRESFNPECDYLIFLGDYADRGRFGVEVIEGLVELTERYPGRVAALKGNHEDYSEVGVPRFTPCTLISEAELKKESWETYFHSELQPFLSKLYLAALIPGEVLFVHGGVSLQVKDVECLENPSRDVEEDVLWSDPFEGDGERPNMRGAGIEFGEDVSEEVCRRLNVKRIVRSHQPGKAAGGPYVEHGGRVITVSSTNVYGGTPFVLVLPLRDISDAFKQLEKHVKYLR